MKEAKPTIMEDHNSTQTDANLVDEWLNERFKAIYEEKQSKSVDKNTETEPVQGGFAELSTNQTYDNNDDQFIMIPNCDRSSICSSSGNEPYEKIIIKESETTESLPKFNKMRRSKSVENVNVDALTNSEAHYRKSKNRSRPVSLNLSDKTITEQKNNKSGTSDSLKSSDTHTNLVEDVFNEFNKKPQLNSLILEKDKDIDDDEGLELGEFYDEDYDMDLDRISIETDAQTVIMVDMNTEKCITDDTPVKILDPVRTEAIRKLLTEPPRSNQPFFQRDIGNYRSFRTEKNKPDDLDYITDRHSNVIICFYLFIF